MPGLPIIDTVFGHDYTISVTGVVTTGRPGMVTSRHAMLKEYPGSFNKKDAKDGTTIHKTVVYVVDSVKGYLGV